MNFADKPVNECFEILLELADKVLRDASACKQALLKKPRLAKLSQKAILLDSLIEFELMPFIRVLHEEYESWQHYTAKQKQRLELKQRERNKADLERIDGFQRRVSEAQALL